jgi:hypothetical protein
MCSACGQIVTHHRLSAIITMIGEILRLEEALEARDHARAPAIISRAQHGRKQGLVRSGLTAVAKRRRLPEPLFGRRRADSCVPRAWVTNVNALTLEIQSQEPVALSMTRCFRYGAPGG